MRFWNSIIRNPAGPMGTKFIIALALNGPVFAALQFGEVIARKSLHASPLMITLFTMIMPVTSITALWWGRLLEGRDQRKILLIGGIVGNLSIMSCFYLKSMPHLMISFLIYFMFLSILMTSQNRILQQHIKPGSRGSTFGLSNSIRMGLSAILFFVAGVWMDKHTTGYQEVYLITGILGILSVLFVSSIPTKPKSKEKKRVSLKFITSPFVDAVKLLKMRPDFFRFEIAFMLYGIAFMMTLPVVPIFLVDVLQLDYTVIGITRGALTQLIMLPSVFIFGKLFDRMTPHSISTIVFGMLVFFPILLIMASLFEGSTATIFLYSAFLVFGAAMGGVLITWNMASVRFTREDEDAGVYQAVHIAATGVRGSFAPLLSLLTMTLFGPIAALVAASFFWLLSSILMFILNRRDGHLVKLNVVS
jgi:MFS family permease